MSYSDFMSRAIEEIDGAVTDPELDFIQKQFENITINDIVLGSDSAAPLYIFLQHKFSFTRKYNVPYGIEYKQNEIKDVANSIYTASNWFYESIQTGNEKLLLSFWVIISFLDIEANTVIKHEKIDNEQSQSIINKIEKLLSSFQVDISLPSNVPYREKELYQAYEEGIQENNFYKIYEFMDAYNRSGRSCVPQIITSIICTLFVLSEETLVKAIKEKKSPLEVDLLLKSLPSEALGLREKLTDTENVTLLFGLLRTYATKDAGLSETDRISLIENSVIRLADLNEAHFVSVVRLYRCSYVFYAGVLKSLQTLNEKFSQMFCNNIELSKNHDEIRKTLELLNFGEKCIPNHVLINFSRHMYQKYLSYLNNLVEKGETAGTLILSNWFPFVIFFLKESEAPKSMNYKLQVLLEDAVYLNSIWHQNGIEAKTKFFIIFSKIYMYITALRNIGIRVNSQLTERNLRNLLDDKRIWLEYFEEIKQPKVIQELYIMFFQTKIENVGKKRVTWRRRGWGLIPQARN